MSKTNAWENGLLLLVFNNTNFANVGDATGLRGSSAAGNLHLSLHTSDPGEAGSQTTNEIAYTSYARVAVARSGAGFIGTDLAGAGTLLYKGTVTPNIVCGSGITPQLTTASTVTED